MFISNDIRYIGVNDHQVTLFEGQYDVPLGMAYNSYVILDEKVAVMDTVDAHFGGEWMDNLTAALAGRTPDYLVVQHMEPDHSANIVRFMDAWPAATVVASQAAFRMMKQFYGSDYADRRLAVGEGDTLALGHHTLTFLTAPMVHWPEVIVTYDSTDKVLFSADGLGKFGALDVEDPEGWACEARRYYFGIVGKFGAQVQALLKKASAVDIQTVCPPSRPGADRRGAGGGPAAVRHLVGLRRGERGRHDRLRLGVRQHGEGRGAAGPEAEGEGLPQGGGHLCAAGRLGRGGGGRLPLRQAGAGRAHL